VETEKGICRTQRQLCKYQDCSWPINGVRTQRTVYIKPKFCATHRTLNWSKRAIWLRYVGPYFNVGFKWEKCNTNLYAIGVTCPGEGGCRSSVSGCGLLECDST